MSSTAVDTQWVPIVSSDEIKEGDVVRVKPGMMGDMNLHGGALSSQVPLDGTVIVRRTFSGSPIFYGDGAGWAFDISQFDRRVKAETPALDPHKVSSYKPGTEWEMVTKGGGISYEIRVTDEGRLTERNKRTGGAPYDISAGHIERQLRDEGSYTMALVAGGLKDGTPAVPEMYTEDWFKGFLKRALDMAEEHGMCGVVERFLDAEKIDHAGLADKTAVVKLSIEMTVELDMSRRGAYDEYDIDQQVERRVREALWGLRGDNAFNDGNGSSFDDVRVDVGDIDIEVSLKDE